MMLHCAQKPGCHPNGCEMRQETSDRPGSSQQQQSNATKVLRSLFDHTSIGCTVRQEASLRQYPHSIQENEMHVVNGARCVQLSIIVCVHRSIN